MIDNEKVPWGKDEKNHVIKKMEWKDLEVIWVKQSEKNDVPFA